MEEWQTSIMTSTPVLFVAMVGSFFKSVCASAEFVWRNKTR